MEITYIGHSGFLIEWDTCYWLFDYYQGDIPEMDGEKKIIVFASHKHRDHFNPEIFSLYGQYKDVEYVLSSDIHLLKENPGSLHRMDVADGIYNKILSVKPSSEYEIYDKHKETIRLKTLKSTDCGVAFLLFYQGKTIYHAGDLNLWIWKKESKQTNNNMTARFNREMACLKDVKIDIAFVPLDPRQEEWYSKGLEGLLNAATVRYAFPMHFWNKPYVIQQFKREKALDFKHTEIMDISRDGQTWTLDI